MSQFTVTGSRLLLLGALICFVLALFGVKEPFTFKLAFVLWTASALV